MSIASALSRSAHLEQVSVVASSLPSPAHQFAKLWNCKHTNVSITRNAQKQLHCGGLWVRHGVSKSRVVKTIRKLNRLNIITIVKIYMLFKKPMSATSKALLVNPGSFLRLMDTKIISCKEMHSCRCTSSGKNLSTAVGVILVGAWRCRLEIRLHTNMNFLKLKPCAQWKGFPHLEWTSQKKIQDPPSHYHFSISIFARNLFQQKSSNPSTILQVNNFPRNDAFLTGNRLKLWWTWAPVT